MARINLFFYLFFFSFSIVVVPSEVVAKDKQAINNKKNKSYAFILANNPDIQYYGRWDFRDSLNPAYSWPGIAVSIEFSGRSIGVRMNDNAGYYNVIIDGKSFGVFHGDKRGTADYILADSLPQKHHSLRLSLRNFSFDTVYTFSGFLIDGGARLFHPHIRHQKKIEFIGDSFTAAAGNEAKDLKMEWSATFPVTNIDLGFAAMIARHYKADYHTICRSGIGMLCDWTGNMDLAMPKFYDRTLMERSEPKWDFASWQPDLVVLALGGNDFSGLSNKDSVVSQENSEIFRNTYRTFLATIRRVYPGTKILAVAIYPDWVYKNIRQVVEDENSSGNKDVAYAQFDYFPGGYVCNGHPTIKTHCKMAKQIITAIDELKVFSRHKK